MSRSASVNTACSICNRGIAKWMCKCGNEALCAEGTCLAAHMSKSARAHVLVEYEVGVKVSGDLTAACFQHFDKAMEAAEYLNGEVQWLTAEKNRLEDGIDRQVEMYIIQIRRLAEEKKRELDQLLQEKIQSIEAFRDTDKTMSVLEHKHYQSHLEVLECTFGELATDSLINLSGTEKVYQFSNQPSEGSWGFNGPIDALSIQVSRKITLRGLGLTNTKSGAPLSLHSLQVLKGKNTVGEVLYSDTDTRKLVSDHSYLAKVMLKKPVSLFPGLVYTLRVQIIGGYGHSTGSTMPEWQSNLAITTSSAVVKEAEGSNGSGPKQGIFFEVYYS